LSDLYGRQLVLVLDVLQPDSTAQVDLRSFPRWPSFKDAEVITDTLSLHGSVSCSFSFVARVSPSVKSTGKNSGRN
jgi:hypothetical protein